MIVPVLYNCQSGVRIFPLILRLVCGICSFVHPNTLTEVSIN